MFISLVNLIDENFNFANLKYKLKAMADKGIIIEVKELSDKMFLLISELLPCKIH